MSVTLWIRNDEALTEVENLSMISLIHKIMSSLKMSLEVQLRVINLGSLI
jgi:hypothetical protein